MHINTTIGYFFYVIAGKSFISNLYACKNMHVVGKSMHILGIVLDSGWESFRRFLKNLNFIRSYVKCYYFTVNSALAGGPDITLIC